MFQALIFVALLAPAFAAAAPRRAEPKPKPAATAPATSEPASAPAPPEKPAGPPASLQAQPGPATASRSPLLLLAPRAGVTFPLRFLRPGWEAGLEARVPLLLEGRLSAGARLSAAQMGGVGPALIPGRGHDPALVQNRFGGQLQLFAEYAVLGDPMDGLTFSLGYALHRVQDEILVLGGRTVEVGFGHAVVGGAAYRLGIGPGSLGVHLNAAFGGAALGPLARYGTESLSSLSLLLSYDLAVLWQENRR